MICSTCTKEGNNIGVGSDTVIQSYCNLIHTSPDSNSACGATDEASSATDGRCVRIGDKNVIEEYVTISNSTLGNGNLIGVKCVIEKSTIGDRNIINPSAAIIQCIIGSNCHIASKVTLTNVRIPDNTSVICTGSSNGNSDDDQVAWKCISDVDTSAQLLDVEQYRCALQSMYQSNQNVQH